MLFALQKMSRDCCLRLPAVTWVLLLVTTGEPDLPFLAAEFPLAPYMGSEMVGKPVCCPAAAGTWHREACEGQLPRFPGSGVNLSQPC